MMQHDVHAIVVTFNSADVIEACLRSLGASHIARVTVFDNASQDDTVRLASAFEDVEVIKSPENLGLARATNRAAASSGHNFLLLMNADTEVTATSVGGLITAAAHHASAGVLAPKLVGTDGATQYNARRFPGWRSNLARRTALSGTRWGARQDLLHRYGDDPQAACEPDWVLAACVLIRRECWVAVGGMDERYFLYCEDVDLCARSWLAGWSVRLVTDVTVVHGYQRSSRNALRVHDRATRAHLESMVRWMSGSVRRRASRLRSGMAR